MPFFRHIVKRLLTPALGLILALGAAGTAAVSFAQTGGPQISNITVNSISDTGAAITFSTSAPAGAKILYGTTTAYGSSSPVLGYTTPEAVSHSIPVGSLTPSTTYHFQIEASNSNGVTKSADRSFTTRASAGSTSDPLVLTNIVADCVDTRCQILFTPNKPANVQIVWDERPNAGFTAYPASNIVSDPVGSYSAARRALAIPSSGTFLADNPYYYRLRGVDQTGSSTIETNDLQFRTSRNANDHTFSTGGCDVSGTIIPIGTCGPGGYYCSSGGVAVQDCTQSCGFTCPADSTCRTNGNCEADPRPTGSPYQCNNTTSGPANCFDDNGQFLIPAPAGCYETWGKCNANTILKVRKDRGCNLWLTCATSVQTEPKQGAPAENLCLSLAACNSISQDGQCNSYLPQSQCNNNPLRFCATDADCEAGGSCNIQPAGAPTQSLRDLDFTTPAEVKQIANLSGNVIAGLDWNTLSDPHRIQGNLPWQLMRQIGGVSQIINGDLEANPPNPIGWTYVPAAATSGKIAVEFEDQNNSINHILRVPFVTQQLNASGTCSNSVTTACTVDGDCSSGGTCNRTEDITFSGAATDEFTAEPGELYYGEVRIRADGGVTPTVRIQFGYNDYTQFFSVDVTAKSAWQRVPLGPIAGMSGKTRFAVVCADNATCTDTTIFIDDVKVKPVLQVNTNPSYITPSCRLYPKSDSPACDYYDQNGILYKGWKGYCLETDSITGTCLSWWPVDILRGESDLFGSNSSAGYDDRAPLYLCAEAAGNNKGGPFSTLPYVLSSQHDTKAVCNDAGDDCYSGSDNVFENASTIAACSTAGSPSCAAPLVPTDTDYHIREDEISQMVWVSAFMPSQNTGFTFENTVAFQNSSPTVPYKVGCLEGDTRICYKIFRNTNDNGFISWNYLTDCPDGGLNQNCISGKAVFNRTTKELLRYTLDLNDQTDSSTIQGAAFKVLVTARESCNQLVEVVQPNGINQAFASRVKSSVYSVPDLGHQQFSDLAPFGGAYGPLGGGVTPANWPLLSIQQQNLTRFEHPGQPRGGQPYACNGPCTPFVCDWNPGLSCLNSDGTVNATAARQCETKDFDGDGEGDGICTGGKISTGSNVGPQSFSGTSTVSPTTDNTHFAQEHIRRVFAQGYSIWSWSNGAYQQSLSNGIARIPWLSPDTLCPFDNGIRKRPAYPNDYCAVPPSVVNDPADENDGPSFINGSGSEATITGGGGSIGIKFNTSADPEQVPLESFTIDWGDTSDPEPYDYRYAPKNDPSNPHVFSHVYTQPGTYQIRIQVKDNWGWCNNATETAKCPTMSSANDTGLTVRVQP